MSYSGYAKYDDSEDDVMLEPRLLEYIQKKKYYKQNSIDVDTLNKDYNISKPDMIKIRAYLRGDKNTNYASHQDFVDTSDAVFPSDQLKKDPRLKRIKENMKIHTEQFHILKAMGQGI